MIQLEIGVQKPVFDEICRDPNKIIQISKDWYDLFMNYMIQEELYEYIPNLQKIYIIDKNWDEFIENESITEI